MIKLFVKVSGEMQSYETPYYAPEASAEMVRNDVKAILPKATRGVRIGPILALIDPCIKKYDQFVLGF